MAALAHIEHARVGSPLGFPATVTAVYFPPSPVTPGNPAGLGIFLRRDKTLTRYEVENAIRRFSNSRTQPTARVGQTDPTLGRIVEVINYAGAFPVNELDRSETLRMAQESGPINSGAAQLRPLDDGTVARVVQKRREDRFARVVRPLVTDSGSEAAGGDRGSVLPLVGAAVLAGASLFLLS